MTSATTALRCTKKQVPQVHGQVAAMTCGPIRPTDYRVLQNETFPLVKCV